jgi:hypothetical protein
MYHWMAVDLHFWRTRFGMSCAEVGALIGLTRGSVSNIEACRPGHRLNEKQAAILDETWNLGGHFTRQVKYAKQAHDPEWGRSQLALEARAHIIKIFETMYVPGLFQTPEYARAIFEMARSPTVEADVDKRMSRRAVLAQDPMPHIQALIDESVVDRPVGGRAAMRAQHAHLLKLTQLPNVALRIIPQSVGEYIGMDGPFEIFSVLEGKAAFSEAHGGGRLILDTAEVDAFEVVFDQIGADALPREATRERIRRAMEVMR